MPENDMPTDGKAMPNVPARNPKRTPGYRSAITARPEARLNGNSPVGRRVRDLFAGLMERLNEPADITIQAAVLALSELLTAAELARANLLEGRTQSSNELVRLENLVRRAEIRVGLVPSTASSDQSNPNPYAYGGLFVDDDDDDAEEPAQ